MLHHRSCGGNGFEMNQFLLHYNRILLLQFLPLLNFWDWAWDFWWRRTRGEKQGFEPTDLPCIEDDDYLHLYLITNLYDDADSFFRPSSAVASASPIRSTVASNWLWVYFDLGLLQNFVIFCVCFKSISISNNEFFDLFDRLPKIWMKILEERLLL